MTDFIVYISAQQRMQAVMNETEALDTPRRGRKRLMAWAESRTIRRRISRALYRMADAVQPIGEPASVMPNAPH